MSYDIWLNPWYTCNGSTILYVAYTVYTEHKITTEGEFIFERYVLDLITRFLLLLCALSGRQTRQCWPHLGFFQAWWLREITKDAYNILLLFGWHVTWGRKTVHQLLFFSNLLASYLSSNELAGSTVEKDGDKGDRNKRRRRREGQKHWHCYEVSVKGEAVRGMKGLLAWESLDCSQQCNDTSVFFCPCCWTCWYHFQLLLFENVSSKSRERKTQDFDQNDFFSQIPYFFMKKTLESHWESPCC